MLRALFCCNTQRRHSIAVRLRRERGVKAARLADLPWPRHGRRSRKPQGGHSAVPRARARLLSPSRRQGGPRQVTMPTLPRGHAALRAGPGLPSCDLRCGARRRRCPHRRQRQALCRPERMRAACSPPDGPRHLPRAGLRYAKGRCLIRKASGSAPRHRHALPGRRWQAALRSQTQLPPGKRRGPQTWLRYWPRRTDETAQGPSCRAGRLRPRQTLFERPSPLRGHEAFVQRSPRC
mmetsp:Transcript_41671/g.98821  ORF Transcript_41671/g.98821 Transcript_41671/m.98821 type:complete len:236 (-) Transcript_41671:2437-3144(-)